MSRADRHYSSDPAAVNVDFNAKKGTFRAYHKEKKTKAELKYPFSFIVLDQAQQVVGYNNKLGASVLSNMSKSNAPGYFKVRLYGGEDKDFPIEGFWKEIKEKVETHKGRWGRIVYALMDKTIVRIVLVGKAAVAFSDIKKEYEGTIEVTGTTKETNGDVEYHIPVFVKKEITEEEDEHAVVVSKTVIQPFLMSYFNEDAIDDKTEREIKEGPTPHLDPKEDLEADPPPNDDLPF